MKSGLRSLIVLFGLVAVAACGHPDQMEIVDARVLSTDAEDAVADATSRERFVREAPDEHAGHDHGAGEHVEAEPEVPFVYDVPEGWVDLGAAGQRWINLQPGGDERASCYLSILPGDGGGLLANVNRWRTQIGMRPLLDAELDDLPMTEMLNHPATVVRGDGRFTGMGDVEEEDFGLLGLIQIMRVPIPGGQMQTFAAFVKMTGPADVVAANEEQFRVFYESLTPRGQAEAETQAQPADSAVAAADTGATGALIYETPEGWTDRGPSGMRLADMLVGEDMECSVIRLGGSGGGLASNVNRWRKQLGLDAFSETEVAAMPTVKCLATAATLFDATGSYAGMTGASVEGARMLGAMVIGTDASYFIKMTGPAAAVTEHEESFRLFLRSLRFDA